MPLFDYYCEKCKKKVELITSPNTKPYCPICGEEMKKLPPKIANNKGNWSQWKI